MNIFSPAEFCTSSYLLGDTLSFPPLFQHPQDRRQPVNYTFAIYIEGFYRSCGCILTSSGACGPSLLHCCSSYPSFVLCTVFHLFYFVLFFFFSFSLYSLFSRLSQFPPSFLSFLSAYLRAFAFLSNIFRLLPYVFNLQNFSFKSLSLLFPYTLSVCYTIYRSLSILLQSIMCSLNCLIILTLLS
jgi:hypothetical protein